MACHAKNGCEAAGAGDCHTQTGRGEAPERQGPVSDNGAGLSDDMDIRKTKSLGLRLVTTLAEHQLQGKLELDRTNGTEFRIRFRETAHKRT